MHKGAELLKYRYVIGQCAAVINAYNELGSALESSDVELFWEKAQAMVVVAANVSKLLWGENKQTMKELQPFRDSLGVNDEMVIKSKRVRNRFEHLSERLDKRVAKHPEGCLIDGNIGPMNAIKVSGIDPEIEHKQRLRHFDPTTGIITVEGEEFPVRIVALEAQTIHKRAIEIQKLLILNNRGPGFSR